MPYKLKNCSLCNGIGSIPDGVDGYGLPIWKTCYQCGGMCRFSVYEPDATGDKTPKTLPRPARKTDPTDGLANFISTITGISFFIYLSALAHLEWYYHAGIAFSIGFGINYILKRPLRWLTTLILKTIRTLMIITGWALCLGIIALILQAIRVSG